MLVKKGTAASSECLLFKLAIRVACQFLQHTHTGSLCTWSGRTTSFLLSRVPPVQGLVFPQVLQKIHSSSHYPDPCILKEHRLTRMQVWGWKAMRGWGKCMEPYPHTVFMLPSPSFRSVEPCCRVFKTDTCILESLLVVRHLKYRA